MTPEADFLVALGSFIRTWLNRLNEMNGRAGWHGASWRHHPPRPSCWQEILDVHSCLDIVPWSLLYKALMGWAASSWGIFSVVTDLAMCNICLLLYGITRVWERVVTNSFPDNLIHCSVPLHMSVCVHMGMCVCMLLRSSVHSLHHNRTKAYAVGKGILNCPPATSWVSSPVHSKVFCVFIGNMDIYIYIFTKATVFLIALVWIPATHVICCKGISTGDKSTLSTRDHLQSVVYMSGVLLMKGML